MNAAVERYPERWLDYVEARDVYAALPHLHSYAREWLELAEIFASFDVLGDVNVALVPAHVARGAKYSVPITINAKEIPKSVSCFCCVPQYTGDILGEGYDVGLMREAVTSSLASLIDGGNFVCKVPPGNYSEELFTLIALCQKSFHHVSLCSPSVGSPDVDCRYLFCEGRGEPIDDGEMSVDAMMRYAIQERGAQEVEMTREFLGGVDYPESKAMVDAAVLDWNKHAHLLRRAIK